MPEKPASRSDRIYRRLLRLLPFAFQREYGAEMEGVFRPLPVAEPDRVIPVFANNFSDMAYNDYTEYRDRNRTMTDLSAFGLMDTAL